MTETFAQWSAGAQRVEVDGLSVAAHDRGRQDGPAVTFLHGYPSSSHDVLPVLERLGDEVRLVTLDLPGFGASDKPWDVRHTINRAADAVEATWRQLGVSSSVLLAHDYGVSVGQELLARHAPVTAVVWCNGGLYPDLHRPTAGQQMLLDPEHGGAIAAAVDRALFGNALAETWGTRQPLSDDVVDEVWASMAHDGGVAQMHRLLHYVADRREHADRWIAALEGASIPMRFVWGELDPVSGAHVADRLATRLPEASLTRLADVGHWPPLEAPDEVAAAVRLSLPR